MFLEFEALKNVLSDTLVVLKKNDTNAHYHSLCMFVLWNSNRKKQVLRDKTSA